MFSGITSFVNGLRANPAGTLITLVYTAVCILFSLIIHEVAHGWVALKCGDPTAKWMGRLSLDPRKHLDPYGTICMLLLHIGWAKPVPVNPRNFKNYRRDYILVSLAGIAVNLCVCLLSLIISALLAKAVWSADALKSVNGKYFLDLYHYLPANAVYGGEIGEFVEDGLIVSGLMAYVQRIFLMLAQMNLGLAIFNLLPVPPLDGYRFLDQFVFKGRLALEEGVMQTIRIVFLVVCFSGLLDGLLTTVNSAVFSFFSGLVAVLI